MGKKRNCFLIYFFALVCTTTEIYAQEPSPNQDSINLVALGKSWLSKVNDIDLSPDSNIYMLKQAIPYFEQSKDINSLVFCYNNLSVFHYFNNDFDEAEKVAKTAKTIAEEKLGTDHLYYIDALFNLTAYLDLRGFHEEAIEIYHKIIESDKNLKTPMSEVATTYQNLALSYLDIGDYEEAIEALGNVLRIRQNMTAEDGVDMDTNRADTGGAYSELADCYKRKKEPSRAIDFFNKSLDVLSSFDKKSQYINQVRYNCYYKLAEIYLEDNQIDLAYDNVYKAVEIEKKNNVFGDCFSYLILGKLNLFDGKKERAFSYYEKAIEKAINEAGSFTNFPQIAAMFLEKGNAHLQLAEYDLALTAFQKALHTTSLDFESDVLSKSPSLDQIFQKLGTLDIITSKAKTFLAKYKSNESNSNELSLAYDHYIQATQLIQVIRQGYNTDAAKHTLAKKANIIYEKAIEVCDLLYAKTKDLKYHKQAFVFAERNKAITLLESINESTALNISALPDSLLELERALSIRLTFEEGRLASEKAKKEHIDQTLIDQIKAKRFNIKEEYKNLIRHFEKDYPQYYQQKYANINVTVDNIQNDLLDDETALVEYFVGEQFIYSFIITKDRFKVEKLKKTSSFEEQINTLRQTISAPPVSKTFAHSFQVFSQTSHNFYKTMFQKHMEVISDTIKNLIIIPDDIIGFVPFDLLLTEATNLNTIDYNPKNLSYLMERFFVSYSYSGTLLLNEQKTVDEPKGLGFIGFAPSFGERVKVAERACSDSELYSLKCSVEEVSTINENFKGKIIKGIASTKAAFLEKVSNYDIVHLATHACVSEDNAMLNRIHFTDDYITMYDLSNLKLKANLVVLSACNTGSGKMVKGEGVMSLSRGFIQSGAASTLMSLWSVDDCATSDIMTSFYTELANGHPKNEALQKAKLHYISNASDKAKAHPYYWAAFLPFGDTSSLVLNKHSYWQPLALIALISFVLVGFFYKKRKEKA